MPTTQPTISFQQLRNLTEKWTWKDPMMGSQSSRIAAYQMGFDYVGCELDPEYYAKGCERFNRECKGEIKTEDGKTIKQLTLFDI